MVLNVHEQYDLLIERIQHWAQGREDVRALLIVGSRARDNPPADEWSDLDVPLFVTDVATLAADCSWIEEIGQVLIRFQGHTPEGGPEPRVLFEGGLDVDLPLVPIDPLRQWAEHGLPAEVAAIFERGMRVLVDKEDLVAKIRTQPAPPPAKFCRPGEAEYQNVVNDFWYHCVWTAKHLRRGEIWWAKSGSDGHLKGLLLRMTEWHARAVRGDEHDTWMRGRFLERWADPRIVAQLCNCFARYDVKDIARTLGPTMAAFRLSAMETAKRWGLCYPQKADDAAEALVRRILGPEMWP